MAVGLQHGDVTGQHTGSCLKVEVGCCLCAGVKQLCGGHETPLPAACPLSPRERERQVIAQQLPTRRKNPHRDAGGRRLLLENQAKHEINISFTVEKKKKKKNCNMGINVNLRWEYALKLLARRGMLWLVHVCLC